MAIAARQLTQEAYEAPSTRVYANGYADTARKPAENRPKPRVQNPEPKNPSPRTRIHRHTTQSTQLHAKTNIGQKLLVLTGICLVASSLLFVLVRYANIAEQYSQINRLKSEIQESSLNIASLNVQFQMAVNLDDARQAALEAGMGYPLADQIIRVGSGSAANDAEPDDSGLPENATSEGEIN